MSKRLSEIVESYLGHSANGGRVEAIASLASKLGIGTMTLRRRIKAGFPDASASYQTALACGCSEAEALEIAKECLHKAVG